MNLKSLLYKIKNKITKELKADSNQQTLFEQWLEYTFDEDLELSDAQTPARIYLTIHMSMAIQNCKDVAFIGAGNGSIMLLLAEANPHIRFTGFESSLDEIELGRAKLKKLGLRNVRFVHAELTKLEIGNRPKFDGLVSDCLFNKIRDIEELKLSAEGLRRLLKSNGSIFLLNMDHSFILDRNKKDYISYNEILHELRNTVPTLFQVQQPNRSKYVSIFRTAKQPLTKYTLDILQKKIQQLSIEGLRSFENIQKSMGTKKWNKLKEKQLQRAENQDSEVVSAIFADRKSDRKNIDDTIDKI